MGKTKNQKGKGQGLAVVLDLGIDYDFRSQHMVLSRLEPLAWLVHRGLVKVSKVKVLTSPSGRGWHVRMTVTLLGACMTQRELELACGDDPFRHCFSWYRGETGDETPLFERKKKKGVWYHEKYNAQMTKRVKELLK
jgi:hypothetical protein